MKQQKSATSKDLEGLAAMRCDPLLYRYESSFLLERQGTPQEALRREIKEELGLTIAVDTYLTSIVWYYPTFTLRMHVDLCTIEEGELNLKEHKDAKWLKLDDLCSVKWLPADTKACKSLKWYETVYHARR